MINPNILINKILVTGGDGVVGSYVSKIFVDSEIVSTNRDSLDVSSGDEVENKIKNIRPDLIIHLAAITDVDLCEKNRFLAENINSRGTENVVRACKILNIPLVYISTSAVFDGKNPNGYSELDSPKPSNIYANTKLLGEKAVAKALNKHLIIRAGWMIGGGNREKKFISYISDKIKRGEAVRAVKDKFGTITYAKDLLEFAKERLIKSEFGLYHYGSKGVCSRYDIACLIRGALNKNSKVIPVLSQEFKNKFSAPRPKYEVVRSVKIPFRKRWDEVVKEYITDEIA